MIDMFPNIILFIINIAYFLYITSDKYKYIITCFIIGSIFRRKRLDKAQTVCYKLSCQELSGHKRV
jgi:hypothetical protein